MKINVCGCSLVDHLFTGIDFNGPEMKPFLSVRDGDGGICPGKLVFAEDLEKFAGIPYDQIISAAACGKVPDAMNLGGPAIVGAINAAQLLYDRDAEFHYYGMCGRDEAGDFIFELAGQTPLKIEHYLRCDEPSPVTDVLSDPAYYGGKGERSFINRVGGAGQMTPDALGDDFFDADILWFAATALVPGIHDALTALLKRGRECGRINVVSTVFDFRNEKRDPAGPWPLGESVESYRYIDLLLVDKEEALRLSGKRDEEDAIKFFRKAGVSSVFVTRGAHDFLAWSDGRLFRATEGIQVYPVSESVNEDLAKYPERRGDTTGCGDNFAGGIVTSLVRQLIEGVQAGSLSVTDAAAWGAASGGAACFCKGGTYIEKQPGEKLAFVKKYADAYPR